MNKPTVFIGSSSSSLPTAELVKTELSSIAQPIVWNEDVFGLGIGTLETLVNALDNFDFAVLLFTPDDPVVHAGLSRFKPRDNVLIEFGLFTGRLGRERTFVMIPNDGSMHTPTDLEGVTIARLKQSSDSQQRYDIRDGCSKIANAIKTKWYRWRLEKELGILYRLVNAFTFPHYGDVHVPALTRSQINFPHRERFDTVDNVVNFLGVMLTDYVYPQLNFRQLESMRVYFAYYLGDGVSNLLGEVTPRVCWDRDSDGKAFAGEFVIGLANPTEMVSEQNWRVGRAIAGFLGMVPNSMCAQVFQSGHGDGFNDVNKRPQGMPNYITPGELSVFSFPVEWRSEEGAGRIGVLTISSRHANSISVELKTIIELLANIVGFLFSLYAVRDRTALEQEGEVALRSSEPMRGFSEVRGDTEQGRQFTAAVVGLRRSVAEYFEGRMLAQQTHQLTDGSLSFLGITV